MSEQKLAEAEAAGLHKVFKLQTNFTCNSMVRASSLQTDCHKESLILRSLIEKSYFSLKCVLHFRMKAVLTAKISYLMEPVNFLFSTLLLCC